MAESKVIASTYETDQACYGELSDPDSGANNTGWFIYMPLSRRMEIARFLGIESVYCVGIRTDPERIFIQPTRNMDIRNKMVEYVEVAPKYVQSVHNIVYREYTESEEAEVKSEDDENMELARRGLL